MSKSLGRNSLRSIYVRVIMWALTQFRYPHILNLIRIFTFYLSIFYARRYLALLIRSKAKMAPCVQFSSLLKTPCSSCCGSCMKAVLEEMVR